MGTCKYCGKDAGLFSHVHKECEEKHGQGIRSLDNHDPKCLTAKIVALFDRFCSAKIMCFSELSK